MLGERENQFSLTREAPSTCGRAKGNSCYQYQFSYQFGAVNYGGTLHIKTGSSPGAANLNKRINVRAYNGPVNIGR